MKTCNISETMQDKI